MGCNAHIDELADIKQPRAYGALDCSARFKNDPDDFRVTERLGFEPGAVGEHLYLHIEKVMVETLDVVERLRAFYGVRQVDVGYAGRKDKRSVARQWFSICTPSGLVPVGDTKVRVVARGRHTHKLRRGEHTGNDFVVRLKDVRGSGWRGRLQRIQESGAPNYFGPQRFAANAVSRATAWLLRRQGAAHTGRSLVGPRGQGWNLSVLRAYLFNEVLGLRVRQGNWNQLLEGDVGAIPSGPMWGRGRSTTQGLAAKIEHGALAGHAEICCALEFSGLRQDRRCLVLQPQDLCWHAQASDVELSFSLGPGSYATSLLREAFVLRGAAGGI
jgi:tRNA pseudouridine13 synthase